ncbi:MAG: hypothetical protein Q7T00_03535 [Rugosibacter sp.]|nr:hypothetical protein [Rugosibacter sp.]
MTAEMNVAMKDFEQRTVILGQRYKFTGKLIRIAQQDYTDRKVIDQYMYLSNESNFLDFVSDLQKRGSISREVAKKRALDVVELSGLQYRELVANEGRHVRFTKNSGGALGFCVEGNAPTNQASSEFRVVATYKDILLYDATQSESLDTKHVGKVHSDRLGKSKERLMLSGKSGKVTYVVVQNRWSSHAGSLLAANDDDGEDMGHIRNIEYTPIANEIFSSRKK